jgi:hypothetical protein
MIIRGTYSQDSTGQRSSNKIQELQQKANEKPLNFLNGFVKLTENIQTLTQRPLKTNVWLI